MASRTNSIVRGDRTILIKAIAVLQLLSMMIPGSSLSIEGPGGGEENPFAAATFGASANFYSGNAQVSVPILIPPGHAQATPDLNLTYSSSAGLSAVGFGWSFNLGVVSMSRRDGVPTCNGFLVEQSYNVSLNGSSNELVRNSSESWHRFKIDAGYSTALADENANMWWVRTSDGMTYQFGGSPESRVHTGSDEFLNQAGGQCSFTTEWHLTRIEDPNGNTIDITYQQNGNIPLPVLIEYGGNRQVPIAHPFRVAIVPEDIASFGKPLKRSFSSGVDQELRDRVEEIVVEAWDTDSSAYQEVRVYTLEYDDSLATREFKLETVAATGMPTRTFSYSTSVATIIDTTLGVEYVATHMGGAYTSGSRIAHMDMNGDGIPDRVVQWVTNEWKVFYGVRGDGESFTGQKVWRTSGIDIEWTLSRIGDKVTTGNVVRFEYYLVRDLDGNGIPDLISRDAAENIRVYWGECLDAYDCGFSQDYDTWLSPFGKRLLEFAVSSGQSQETHGTGRNTYHDVVDMNGDGRPDIVLAGPDATPSEMFVALNHGTGFLAGSGQILSYELLAEDGGPEHDDRSVLAFSMVPSNTTTQWREVQMLDINGDGLLDRIEGDAYSDYPNRIPSKYFAVDTNGLAQGPFDVLEAKYLCLAGTNVSLCGLPAGWAIVGAVSVRLNTGSGFTDRIYSPSPFRNEPTFMHRLRTNIGERTYRDFVDMNGDGRPDWVVTGHYDSLGKTDWYVLYNLGDGRFGGPLEILSPAVPNGTDPDLGDVRPGTSFAMGSELIRKNVDDSSPPNYSHDVNNMLDYDGDGMPELLASDAIVNGEWTGKKLSFEDSGAVSGNPHPHTKPFLLTKIDDGLGGMTYLRYQPSTDFAPKYPPGSSVAPAASRLPNVTWVATGVRRTDGLCDTEPSDWYTMAGNPCLAQGHETVQMIDYANGYYDHVLREFRGFGMVMVRDGAASDGNERYVYYHQDEFLKGKKASEEVWVGGVDLLSRTIYDWQTVSDGLRMQIYLRETKNEEFVIHDNQPGTHANQCVVRRNSILNSGSADKQTRIHASCSMSCSVAPTLSPATTLDSCPQTPQTLEAGEKRIVTTYAQPSVEVTTISTHSEDIHPVWDKPATVSTFYALTQAQSIASGSTTYSYDGLAPGATTRGNLSLEASLASVSTVVNRIVGHDNDSSGSGPGNVTSVLVPVDLQSRSPMTTQFKTPFQLYPESDTISYQDENDVSVQQQVLKEYDLRYGKMTKRTGILGSIAGDVSGATYDNLGRVTCEYGPGTSCAAGSGFTANTEYVYEDASSDPQTELEKLSYVEVRRREPNTPNGYLVSRTYWDALGRPRVSTSEQFIASPPDPGVAPSLQTVVSRHVEYGSNGRVSKLAAPYVLTTGSPSVDPPSGGPAVLLSYVLNGNGAGSGYSDPFGRVWKRTQFDGSATETYYLGDSIRSVDDMGHHSLTRLDEHGRVELVEAHEGSDNRLTWSRIRYNYLDEVIEEWSGDDTSTIVTNIYDLLGRLIQNDDPDSGQWNHQFDNAGNVIFSNDPESNQSVQSCYDELDRVVLQCTRASDAYDSGFCSAASPACVEKFVYHYDEADNVAGVTNLGTGRLTTAEGPDSEHRYVYDVRGRVTTQVDDVKNRIATTLYSYSADMDRLDEMTYPGGEIVYYGYDEGGQPNFLSNVTAAGTLVHVFVNDITYDLRGRTVEVTRARNSLVDEYTYHNENENFQLANITTNSLVAYQGSFPQYLNVSYDDYDGSGRLIQTTDHRNSAGPLSLTATYDFDGAGRLAAVTGPNPENFSYDAIGNIGSIQSVGNAQPSLFSKSGSSQLGPHQFDELGPVGSVEWTMSYNASGQRTGKSRVDGSVTQTYGFDGFGRVSSITVDGVTKTMGFDHTGARVFEERDGVTRRFFGRHAETEGGLIFKYYHIGNQLIAMRTDSAPDLSEVPTGFGSGLPPEAYWLIMSGVMMMLMVPIGNRRVVLGIRISQSGAFGSAMLLVTLTMPMAIFPACGGGTAVRHYHFDQLGNPVAVTENDWGLGVQYRYSVYGEVRRFDQFGATVPLDPENRREFSGYQTDPESELQYADARFYDPSQAQFLSSDPQDVFVNPYAYVGWDPVDFVDPSGETPIGTGFGDFGSFFGFSYQVPDPPDPAPASEASVAVAAGNSGAPVLDGDATAPVTTTAAGAGSSADFVTPDNVAGQRTGHHFNDHQADIRELEAQAASLEKGIDEVIAELQQNADLFFDAGARSKAGIDVGENMKESLGVLADTKRAFEDRSRLLRRGEAIANQQDVVAGALRDASVHLNDTHGTNRVERFPIYINRFFQRVDAITPSRFERR